MLPESIIDLADDQKLALTKDYLLTLNRQGIYQQYPLAKIYDTIIKKECIQQEESAKLLYDFVWLKQRKKVFLASQILLLTGLLLLGLIQKYYL